VIDALIWSGAFVLMVLGLGGSAVLCVHMVESGKNSRLNEVEKTKRQGMDNAWQLERERLQSPALGPGSPKMGQGVTFDLPGGQDSSWK
jgi:hypothetical protein